MSASRAVTVAKPSFSRVERMASITSSRELKIATRGADVRGARRSSSPLCTPVMCRGSRPPEGPVQHGRSARRGTDASCGSTGEPPMHQRGAASLHLATWVAMLKQARHRSSRFDGAPTPVPQQDDGPGVARCQELIILFIFLIYIIASARF